MNSQNRGLQRGQNGRSTNWSKWAVKLRARPAQSNPFRRQHFDRLNRLRPASTAQPAPALPAAPPAVGATASTTVAIAAGGSDGQYDIAAGGSDGQYDW